MIRFNFKGTLQRLAQVRAFLGDINTPGGLVMLPRRTSSLLERAAP